VVRGQLLIAWSLKGAFMSDRGHHWQLTYAAANAEAKAPPELDDEAIRDSVNNSFALGFVGPIAVFIFGILSFIIVDMALPSPRDRLWPRAVAAAAEVFVGLSAGAVPTFGMVSAIRALRASRGRPMPDRWKAWVGLSLNAIQIIAVVLLVLTEVPRRL
jgi:hypothetical protein